MNKRSLSGRYDIVKSININATQDKAWQVLRDFNNVYTWAPGVKESYGLNNKSQEIGAGRHCLLDGFGEIDEYILDWEKGSGFTYDVTPLGPLTNASSRWRLSSAGNGVTKLKIVFNYDLRYGLFGKIMHKLIMRKKLNDSLPQALDSFKQRVETGKLFRPLLKEALSS